MRVKHRKRSRSVKLVADDDRLVSHSGLLVVEKVVERLGLEDELTEAVGLTFRSQPPGRTLVRLAQMLIAGGDCVRHLDALRDQPALWAEQRVAHPTTAWRLLAERLVGSEAVVAPQLGGIADARRVVRERAWQAGLRPASVTIDIDAHLITSHSEQKEAASKTYKRTFGHNPMLAYLAETNEALAGILRPGCGSPMDVSDQLEVVDLALEQLPDEVTPDQVVIRADSAGYAKQMVAGLRERGVGFVIGATLTAPLRTTISELPDEAWQPIVEPAGTSRPDAWVAEAVWPAHPGWPADLRLVVRREVPHVGAQFTFTDQDGHRFQAAITNLPIEAALVERHHRSHAVVEDRIREARQLGLQNLPFSSFHANHAWLQVVLLAQDLSAWTQRLTRPEKTWMEPRTLRFSLIAVAGRLTSHARQRILHLPSTWPWSEELIDAYRRASQISVPTPI